MRVVVGRHREKSDGVVELWSVGVGKFFYFFVIARSSTTKQSSGRIRLRGKDCFAALAMTNF